MKTTTEMLLEIRRVFLNLPTLRSEKSWLMQMANGEVLESNPWRKISTSSPDAIQKMYVRISTDPMIRFEIEKRELAEKFRPGSDLRRMFELLADSKPRTISEIDEVVKASSPDNIAGGKYTQLRNWGITTGKFRMDKYRSGMAVFIRLVWLNFPTEPLPDPVGEPVAVVTGTRITQEEFKKAPAPMVDPIARFEGTIKDRMVGQSQAVAAVVDQYTIYKAGAVLPGRPIGNFFMLGPTGVGKTLLVESVAYALHGDPRKMIKINCGEFQSDHEIAKLIGAPPGYLGHDKSMGRLCPDEVENARSTHSPIVVILFDEIEKAAQAVYQLLLGILDKGELMTGAGQKVDLTRAWIFMTSNVGAREIVELSKGKGIKVSDGVGFKSKTATIGADSIDQVARAAMQHKFSPEFIGRLDVITVFNVLTDDDFSKILDHEVAAVGKTMALTIVLTDVARQELLKRVVDRFYGARSMKNGLRTFLTLPIARLKARGLLLKSEVKVDWEKDQAVVS